MEKKIERLKKERESIDKQIKKIERQEACRGLLKEARKTIGNCYRFSNGYSGSSKSWFIYAIVKDVKLEGSSVHMILNQYEKTADNEIIIKLNSRSLESYMPMHCWTYIPKEMFEKNKREIIKLSKLKDNK